MTKSPITPTPDDGCAWVTGASQGLGLAVAERLATDGWRVAASARNREALTALAERSGGRITAVPLDITDLDAVRAAVAGIEDEVGPIARAVLNAGTYIPETALTFNSVDARTQVELNIMGTIHCLDVIMPAMVSRGRGQIAVVASVAGYRGLPRGAVYGATKSALNTLAESLRFGLEPAGVRIQVINPGFVRTPLTDKNDFAMPFRMEPDAAADKLVRGLARRDFEITFPQRFTFLMKRLRSLPYETFYALVSRGTGAS